MNLGINLNSLRARQARLAAAIGYKGSTALLFGGILLLVVFTIFLDRGASKNLAFGGLSIALSAIIIALWYKLSLAHLPPNSSVKSLDDVIDGQLLARFKKKVNITPRSAWRAAIAEWQGRFITQHLLLPPEDIEKSLSDSIGDMAQVWLAARTLTTKENQAQINAGILATALLTGLQGSKEYLARHNLKIEEVEEVNSWLQRLNHALADKLPIFGGIGRDWAAGYTPMLDQLGQNISQTVERGYGHFQTLAHADVLNSVVHSLSQGHGSVALVGPAGTGKTSLVYALAERLLSGQDRSLLYYQIVNLNASAILSESQGQLEKAMLSLLNEAAHARNVIIFLDEAELFLEEGTGSFDAGKILLPLLQSRVIKLVTAFTPEEWQNLKSSKEELANHMDAIILTESDQPTTMKILEDTALGMETQNQIMISFQAVNEAYRLSGRYAQDQAYPGKAISMLEAAIPFVNNKIMTAESVQMAVEKTRGVKVAKAEGPEANVLLHLEDLIHNRMINQERAVSVVSAALRRGRAGVADPKRPIGSFLFLGPTGVGKTELARSLAAVYFGDERQMIRLDMTEYQQSEDVERLLEVGNPTDKSLILKIREQPFSVVLLDEVEKAHPAVLNLLLQLLDEGQLTDKSGKAASFRNAIVIATSNAGSVEIAQRVAKGDSLESFERPLVDQLISQGQFKVELINRFDGVVLFRPLNEPELNQVAKLMLTEVNKNLATQNVTVNLTDAALTTLVRAGYDPEFGARPMRRVIQQTVEDAVATRILQGQAQPGSSITIDVGDLPKKITV